ncbi:hypothetical protein KSD_55630 [Ktedonobacter sp. SOSP1-85]|nr:hypothetical protein KSD_55630 [Ktedonobacter sp. SOSP1-85]
MTTIETALTGRIPFVNLDHVSTIPVGLVFELGHKLAPSHIADRFAEGWVLDHVLDCQRLDTHHLVLAYESGRKFVQARHGGDQRYGHECVLR